MSFIICNRLLNKNRIIIPKTFKTRLGKEEVFQGFNQHDSEEALSLI